MTSPWHHRDGRALFLGLFNNLKHLAALKGVPLEAIQWLLSESGRPVLERLVEQMHAEWLKQSPPTIATGSAPFRSLDGSYETPFSTWVKYDRETLLALSRLYLTQCPPDPPAFPEVVFFEPIYCCEGISRTPRMVAFDFLDIRNKRDAIGMDEVMFRMHREQVRPALPEEALGLFGARGPEIFYRERSRRSAKGKVPVYVLGALSRTYGDGDWERKYLRISPAPHKPFGVEFDFIDRAHAFRPRSSFLVVRE